MGMCSDPCSGCGTTSYAYGVVVLMGGCGCGGGCSVGISAGGAAGATLSGACWAMF